MEKVVSHSDVNTMDARKAEGTESCGSDDKSNKSDCNIFDLFSPIIPYTLHECATRKQRLGPILPYWGTPV